MLATGAPLDRSQDIPGSDAAGVYGSGVFVGWYNGHPDFSDLNPDLNTSTVVVIGNGNVAIDVARVLVKTPEEMANSDLAAYAAAVIHRAPIEDVYLIGRRGPVEAKFTNKELAEMGDLAACAPVVDPAQRTGRNAVVPSASCIISAQWTYEETPVVVIRLPW